MPLVILGIDPGIANTGWALIECEGSHYRCRGYGCIRTGSTEPPNLRLRHIHEGLTSLIAQERPTECALEDVYFSKNVRTAFATGQARGVAMLATALAGLTCDEYGPSEVKLAVTGHGGADKQQVAYMVRTILDLDRDPEPDHAADALAIAICHANGRGVRQATADSRAAGAGGRR